MNEYQKIHTENNVDLFSPFTSGVHAKSITDSYTRRGDCCREYAWAVPTDEAIQKIVEYSPVVELGAGTGYWAHLVSQAGGDILRYDKAQPLDNVDWGYTKAWCGLRLGGPSKAKKHSDRTLLLVWPPYDNPFAADCLKAYKGSTVIFVGEGEGGCTGDDEFFEILQSSYIKIEEVGIPQWGGIHDYMSIHKRRVG